ncbi:hypothetical protein [Methanofollis tationis]|uniref:Uncharacterized protein n=1 Tax=Methanofollis tationis TaxID=81417 RepID=A0A7K4HQY3_9EURY|nr:hypothetical protein [Methanofollis tationis]NVO67666.1 hypothetical protein [Methanofollis tationis]
MCRKRMETGPDDGVRGLDLPECLPACKAARFCTDRNAGFKQHRAPEIPGVKGQRSGEAVAPAP